MTQKEWGIMENQSKKPELLAAGDRVQEALDIIEDLQRLSYSHTAGEGEFTLSDSRCLLDKAAAHLYDARSEISRLEACEDKMEEKHDEYQ